jgi:hypothetical protein
MIRMKIKVFAFQKDENDILRDWIEYHSYLFGKENIYIIDHDSKDSKSIITNSGVNMINFSGPFAHNKGLQLTKAMNDNKNSCDFVIPLDIDEFLMTQDGGVEKEDVLECFKDLKGCGAYKIVSYSVARHDKDPLTEFTHVTDVPDHGRFRRWKTLWRSKNFDRTDQGNHGFTEGPYEKTKLGMLHFHNRGFEHFKRKNLRWPTSYGNDRKTTSHKHHWEKVWEKIKDMSEEEMLKYWKTLCVDKGNNAKKYQSFKDKIIKLREEL